MKMRTPKQEAALRMARSLLESARKHLLDGAEPAMALSAGSLVNRVDMTTHYPPPFTTGKP